MTVDQAFDLAFQHHQSGSLAEAEVLYRQILVTAPNHFDTLHCFGVLAQQTGRSQSAVDLISRAVALNPRDPVAHLNLGATCRAMGRLDEAIASFRRALEIQPQYPSACFHLGNVLRDCGRLDEAIAAFQQAIQQRPDFAEAHNNLGILLRKQGQGGEAVAAFRRAIALQAGNADTHNNLGATLRHIGELEEAVVALRRAVQLRPDSAEAHSNLGATLVDQGHLPEAIAAHRRALELKPTSADVHNNLGLALAALGQPGEAVAAYHRALELQPDHLEACSNLSIALRECGLLDDAVAACRRALQMRPGYSAACNNLGNALKDQGAMEEALAAYREALQLDSSRIDALGNAICALHYLPGLRRAEIAAAQLDWNRRVSEPVKQCVPGQTNNRDPERPLRIGYVSPEFRDHVIGRHLVPLFQSHDREQFQIICYAGVIDPDAMTEQFRQRAHLWRSSVGVSDEALAAMIHADGIDILVDLTQYLAGNRLPVFARQPAPVQVSFAGYPESTGVDAIRYRISGRWLESEMGDRRSEIRPELQTERVFLLDSFWCYDPCGMEVAVTELPAKTTGYVTFGCLNNFCKVNEPLLRLWARVLCELPDARLVILSGVGSHRQRTVNFLGREGVEPHRVEFVEPRPRKEYLALYDKLDVVLDTFPYNGHTTSLDALWMGVPVVTLAGARAVSRAGLSQLSNLDLPELVASTEGEYVTITTQLANDLPRLAALRSTLRGRMEASVLMNAPHFAQQIEQAYRAMWRRWCAENAAP